MKIQLAFVSVALLVAFASGATTSELYCNETEPLENAVVECKGVNADGTYPLQANCTFTCNEGLVFDPKKNKAITYCRDAYLSDIFDEGRTVWLPNGTTRLCVANPDLRCTTPPAPSNSSGQEEGSVNCRPESGRPGGGWNIGDTCDYVCPEGWNSVGPISATCEQSTLDDTLSFQPSAPCCEPPCNLNEAADVLFIVQQSPCYDNIDWNNIKSFIVDVLNQYASGNVHVGFAFYGFDGVLVDKVIPFSEINDDLKDKLDSTVFKFFRSGSHGVTAIWNVIFGLLGPHSVDGNRPDVPNSVIFVADTQSIDAKSPEVADRLTPVVDVLKTFVEEVMVVGLGRGSIYLPEHGGEIVSENEVFSRELHIIASRPDYVVEVPTIEEVYANFVARVVCKRCPYAPFSK